MKNSRILTTASLILLMLSAAFLLHAMIEVSTGTGEQSYAEESSYIIYRESNLYKVKNGLTGFVEVSYSNAQDAINWAIQHLDSSDGGIISLKAGTYLITSPIILNRKHVTLKGEGQKTTLIVPNSVALSGLYLIKIFSNQQQGNNTDSVLITGLTFWNQQSQNYNLSCAIYLDLTNLVWFVTVQECEFLNTNAIRTNDAAGGLQHSTFRDLTVQTPGILRDASGKTYAFEFHNAIDLTFDNIWIYYRSAGPNPALAGTVGLYIKSDQSSGITIQNLRCFGADFGIYVMNSADTRIVNSICDFAGIAYEIMDSPRCELTNCYAHADFNLRYGFHTKGTTTNAVFANCGARTCILGFYNEASGNCQSYIGCYSDASTWSVGVSKVRGCFNINDQN